MRFRQHHRGRQWSISIILILLTLLAAVAVPSALLGGETAGRADQHPMNSETMRSARA
jgi:hypothetical protein